MKFLIFIVLIEVIKIIMIIVIIIIMITVDNSLYCAIKCVLRSFFNWKEVLIFDNWLFKLENLFHTTGTEYLSVNSIGSGLNHRHKKSFFESSTSWVRMYIMTIFE